MLAALLLSSALASEPAATSSTSSRSSPSSSASSAPATCSSTDRPALVVVLWERRNPGGEIWGFDLGKRMGDRQYEMREALLDVLFGAGDHAPLVHAGDRVTVLPDGFERDGRGWDALVAPTGRPAEMYQRLKVGLPSATDAVHEVDVTVEQDGRAALSARLQQDVTGPMLAPCPDCRDERGRFGAEPAQTRVSEPWLLTHHALATAYVAQGLTAPCAEPDEVYLVWVTTGMRRFDAEDAAARTRDELGELAATWFSRLEAVYRREPVWDDSLVKVWRVHRAAAKAPVDLAWKGVGTGLPESGWSLDAPTGWTVHDATASLRWPGPPAFGVPVALDVAGGEARLADPEAVRSALAGHAGEEETYASLDAAVTLLPPAGDLFGYQPVAVLEPADVAPPKIRVSPAPPPWWPPAAAGALTLVVGGALGRAWWLRTRPRRLSADVCWEGADVVDLLTVRDREELVRKVVVAIGDASGFRPRAADLVVRVTLETFLQPEVPLLDDDRDRFQRLDGWSQATLAAPGRPLDPLTVAVRHAAIDFGKVRKDELVVVQGLRIRVEDATGRYLPFDETRFAQLVLKAVPGPAEPEVTLEIPPATASRHLEARLVGLDDAQWRGARTIDVAWLVVRNPARYRYTPLPVRFRLDHATARLVSETDGVTADAAIRLRDRDGSEPLTDGFELPADGARTLVVTVDLPDVVRDAARTRWTVELEVDVRAEDGGVKAPIIPVQRRSFRLRTSGRSRAMVLDFGTSSVRLLLQDLDEERWGFLPIGDDPAEPADLRAAVLVPHAPQVGAGGLAGPNATHVGAGGLAGPLASNREDLGTTLVPAPDVGFGATAELLARRGSGRLVASIKALLLADDPDAADLLKAAVPALIDRCYAPTVTADRVDGLRMDERLPLSGGPRPQLVALLPNEATPAHAEALRAAVRAATSWDGTVHLLCEAEAIALWCAQTTYGAPPPELPSPPPRLKLLVVDVGAGTTDAALVEVERTPTKRTLRVLATGGSRAAGRTLDEALFDGLCGVARVPYRWKDVADADGLRPDLEAAKRRLREDDAMLVLRAGLGAWDLPLSARMAELRASVAWKEGVRRVAGEAIDVLLGRRAERTLADVDLVVLTGRGALADGLREAVESAVVGRGGPARVHRVDPRLLKAAPSLGARLFALGLAGDFTPAEQIFRDRVVLVLREPRGAVRAVELVGPGRPLAGDVVGPWVDVPAYERAVLLRTWMVPADVATRPFDLDRAAQVAVLQGEPLALSPTLPPPVVLPFYPATIRFDRGREGERYARIRAIVRPDLTVTVEQAEPVA